MNIIFCAPYVPSPVRPRSFNFIRKLHQAGHSITLVSAQNSDPDAQAVRPYCARLITFPLKRSEAIARCIASLPSQKPLEVAYCDIPGLRLAVCDLVAEGKHDLVHVEHLRASLAGMTVSPFPRVYDAVDAMTELWRHRLRSSDILSRLVATIEIPRVERSERAALKYYPHSIVSSDLDRGHLLSLAPEANVRTISNGIDVPRFASVQRHPRRARVLFVGRMSYAPNVAAVTTFVRHVLPKLRLRHPDVEFRIVGAAPTFAVQRLASHPNVSVTGFVPDLLDELSQATLSVCNVPVAGGVQYKILESLAAGVPVVANNLTAKRLELVDHKHALVADSPASIADAVEALIMSPPIAAELGRAGQEYVAARYSLDASVSALVATYSECLSPRSASRRSQA